MRVDKKVLAEIVRFLFTGGTACVLCFSLCVFFHDYLKWHYLIGNNLATLLTWLYSYFLHKFVVFRNFQKRHIYQASSFVTLQIVTVLLANISYILLIDYIGISFYLSLIFTGAAMAGINFLGLKFIVFRVKLSETSASCTAENSTVDYAYTKRLVEIHGKWWKRFFNVQLPYKIVLRQLKPGFFLEIGCGDGRVLTNLAGHGVGIDHNKYSVDACLKKGFDAFTPEGFRKSRFNKEGFYDSIILAHVVEHMTVDEAVGLIDEYKKLLKRGGKVILITPQEKGFESDPTHVCFMNFSKLVEIAQECGFKVDRCFSYPLPRSFGKLFKYNEFYLKGTFEVECHNS